MATLMGTPLVNKETHTHMESVQAKPKAHQGTQDFAGNFVGHFIHEGCANAGNIQSKCQFYIVLL